MLSHSCSSTLCREVRAQETIFSLGLQQQQEPVDEKIALPALGERWSMLGGGAARVQGWWPVCPEALCCVPQASLPPPRVGVQGRRPGVCGSCQSQFVKHVLGRSPQAVPQGL